MSLFEMDFLKKTELLLKEAFKFKKYRAMSPALAVFTGILMIPLVAASFVVTAILAVMCFMFTVLSSPAKYLHDLVHSEGQSVKHATQTAVYLISWPFVFFLYVSMSFLLLLILPTYALLSVLLYAWSLGGFKFHLFASRTEDISIEVKGRYLVLPIVFIIVGYLLVFFIPLIHGVVIYMNLQAKDMEDWFFYVFGGVYGGYIGAHSTFAFLYSLIGFARRPVDKSQAKVADKND